MVERASQILIDAFGRVHESVTEVVRGLGSKELNWRPAPSANSIAWLVWHLARVEDDHLAGVAGGEQLWHAGWYERFALPLDRRDIGYGHTQAQAHSVVVDSADLLAAYHEAVHSRTVQIIAGFDDADYDRIVDRRWDPPVTASVRLVSVVNDTTQHLGQAAYVRGLLGELGG